MQWQQADALRLPFDAASFDIVVCQFGVMFFPDKARAFAEARRVLRRGGVLLFNAWDRIEENEFADVATTTLAELFPADPPRFMARTPHGYFDLEAIARDLANGGFRAPPRIETIAYCRGTPLRGEIEAKGPDALARATDAVASAIAKRFGTGAVEGKIQAIIVSARR